MTQQKITRIYLETLSFADLLSLADSFGIDVPENLNRSFLIGDLLDAAEENKKQTTSDMVVSSDAVRENIAPRMYNTTEVEAILRNPAWVFVFWNMSEADSMRLKESETYALFLRVFASVEKQRTPVDDFYDVQISLSDKSKYILCPAEKQFIYIDLRATVNDSMRVLASTNVLTIPRSSRLCSDMQLHKGKTLSPIMELSGMKELLFEHYKDHRESFF
ncbi:MAG: DUF4912 domain-containing protein [Treponema sp.]|nr:DUF4912 domain-containing protein [Treponema sp.]